MNEPITEVTIAAGLEQYFARDLPFDCGLELRGKIASGEYRVVLFCDGLESTDQTVIYRYLQGHPRLKGLTQIKDRFAFYADGAWAEKVGYDYNNRTF